MSKRLVAATSQSDFEDKLESLSIKSYIEGFGFDRGTYVALVHEPDETTYIDTLKDRLDEYRLLADEVYDIVHNGKLDNHSKIALIEDVLDDAEKEYALVGDHVGTLELTDSD